MVESVLIGLLHAVRAPRARVPIEPRRVPSRAGAALSADKTWSVDAAC
jgi:hypothetical protein